MAEITKNKTVFIIILFAIFIFRLLYGLVSEFWADDERQIYLIGLKYFTTGQWPYYGPDIVYSNSQISGALQGLLVGIPLYISSIPESPYFLLNIMSFAALCFFAWYICKRLPALPQWFVWMWLLTCPWTLWFGTRVINPSYVLPFSILFFVGFFELGGYFTNNIIKPWLSVFFMGLATTAIMQLHMSWILFFPFTAYAIYYVIRNSPKSLLVLAPVYILGIAAGALTLLPTFMQSGIGLTSGGESNIVFNGDNYKNIITVLARYLSFASFEVPYMMGSDTPNRLAVVKNNIWMAPSTIIVLVAGLLQVLFFAVCFFRHTNNNEGWEKIKRTVLLSWLFIFATFFLSIKGPSSHTFYICFPVTMFYSFYCYTFLLNTKLFTNKILVFFIINGIIFHAGLSYNNYKTRSLYTNRDVVVKAIQEKNYKILGERRADAWGYGY